VGCFQRPARALIPLILIPGFASTIQAVTVKDVRRKMGSRFEVTAVHEDKQAAWTAVEAAFAEIDRIETLISSWQEASETSVINRNAGIKAVQVSDELFNLIQRCLKVSELTQGAFDITTGGLEGLWDFRADPPRLPTEEAIAAALPLVNYREIVVDSDAKTVYLPTPGMKIGFGGIGKGYAANRAVKRLKEAGATGGVVNAGGDLLGFGRRENGEEWEIGIAHPREQERIFARMKLTDQAVVTSGDYESFMIIDGKRYAHILDPRTGRPVEHMMSVTVICPDAELADALATSTFVLGPEEGLQLINALREVEAILVDGEGQIQPSHGLRDKVKTTGERP
jgi:thiamine biosynthesis lipoprotein